MLKKLLKQQEVIDNKPKTKWNHKKYSVQKNGERSKREQMGQIENQ